MSRQQYMTREDEEEGINSPPNASFRSRYGPDDSVPARTLWLYGFCACIVLTILVFFGFTFFTWHRGGVDHDHINRVIAELNEDNTQQLDTNNMISFSALSNEAQSQRIVKLTNRLSLCYADLLRTDTDDGRSVIVNGGVDQLSDDKKPFYYMLSAKLTLKFDIDPALFMRDPSNYDHTRRYMTVAYLITSGYSRFSTVKLVETGLDTKNHALLRTNEIILCSDNPNAHNARPCGGSLDESGNDGLFIKNTKLLAMSRLVQWGGAGARKQNNTRSTTHGITTATPKTVGDTTTNDDDSQYDIVHTDGAATAYKAADDFTRDLRMYNIVFYRTVPSGEVQSARFTTFKEEQVLTIRPNKCK